MQFDFCAPSQCPVFLFFRYRTLGATEKKRLEDDEDRLLSTILYNLVSHMVMMAVKQTDVKRKVAILLLFVVMNGCLS